MRWRPSSILLLTAGLLAATPAGAELLSHRAAYRLSLTDGGTDETIRELRGGLVLEWQAACDGWVSNQRMGFVAGDGSGEPDINYDVRFKSWESRDDTRLRFEISSFDGGQLRDRFKGMASLDAPGGNGQAIFEAPDDERLALPAGTLFPTSHVRALIAAAQRGEHFMANNVFDGSGGQGLTQITAVIGAADPVPGSEAEQAPPVPSWHVSLAYYASEQRSETPDFETDFDLAENGVVRDMRMNYGNFVLHAELERLESLPAPHCD